MKKILFTLICLFIAINGFAELQKVDCDWKKEFTFEEIVFEGVSTTSSKLTTGRLLITYKHFGTAGSICTISVAAKGENKTTGEPITLFDGMSSSRFEDVSVYYDSSEKILAVKDKFGDVICAVLYFEKTGIHGLYIGDIVSFANQLCGPSAGNDTPKQTKRSNRRKK